LSTVVVAASCAATRPPAPVLREHLGHVPVQRGPYGQPGSGRGTLPDQQVAERQPARPDLDHHAGGDHLVDRGSEVGRRGTADQRQFGDAKSGPSSAATCKVSSACGDRKPSRRATAAASVDGGS
jgi:hypothetical protein